MRGRPAWWVARSRSVISTPDGGTTVSGGSNSRNGSSSVTLPWVANWPSKTAVNVLLTEPISKMESGLATP